ncbi:MAG: hypothetical protein KF788_06785 [Piscinibacter sp.]|nr:hypothetical protein [Piscinibacter sp.]
MGKLLEVLGLRPLDGPEHPDALAEQNEADDALRLVALQKRLDALERVPPGASDDEAAALKRARASAQAALSARDAALAARELDDLAELERDIRTTAEARLAARLDAQRQRLAALRYPAGLDELPANPLKPLRDRAAKALADRDAEAAEAAVDALIEAIPLAADAIESHRRDQVAALGEQLLELQIPEGAEKDETDLLLPMHAAVLEALHAQQPREAQRRLALLREATGKAQQAIDTRRREKLAAIRKRLEGFAPVAGATDAEARQLDELKDGTLEAIAGGDVQVAEAVMLAYVRLSRATARAVQRRLAEQEAARKSDEKQRQDELDEQERPQREQAAKAAREAAEALRRWISEQIYDRNLAVQSTKGLIVDTPLADAAFELQSLDPSQLEARKAALAGEEAAVGVAYALAQRVTAVREGAPKRLDDLVKKIDRCDKLKGEIEQNVEQTLKRMGGKKELADAVLAEVKQQLKSIDVQKDLLKGKRLALQGVNTAKVTSHSGAVGVLEAAETALASADPAPVFAQVTALRTGLTAKPEPDKLLEVGKAWVGKGLNHTTIQPLLNDAIPKGIPEKIFDARLKVALAEQVKIASADVGKILGLTNSGNLYTGTSTDYLNRPCHISLYKNFYKGKATWEQTADEILDQLVGTTAVKDGLHVTWEWTGLQDSEENLKVFRNGHSNSGGFQAYKAKVGDKRANQIDPTYGLQDIGAKYPKAADAQVEIATRATTACSDLKPRIVERRKNKGLSDAEAAANTADKLTLPPT